MWLFLQKTPMFQIIRFVCGLKVPTTCNYFLFTNWLRFLKKRKYLNISREKKNKRRSLQHINSNFSIQFQSFLSNTRLWKHLGSIDSQPVGSALSNRRGMVAGIVCWSVILVIFAWTQEPAVVDDHETKSINFSIY